MLMSSATGNRMIPVDFFVLSCLCCVCALFPSESNTLQFATHIIHLGRLKIAGLEIRVIPRSLLRLGCSQSHMLLYEWLCHIPLYEYSEFQAIFHCITNCIKQLKSLKIARFTQNFHDFSLHHIIVSCN